MALVFEFSSQQRVKEEYRQMPTAEFWRYLLELSLSPVHQFGKRGISEISHKPMISPAIDRLKFCGHNRRGTERSKLRIFEIDLLIIWYQTPGKSIYSFHPKFFCPNITLGYKTKPYGTTYGTSYQRSSLLCGPLWEQYNIELDLNLSDYFFTSEA